jgi:hypothetical protein
VQLTACRAADIVAITEKGWFEFPVPILAKAGGRRHIKVDGAARQRAAEFSQNSHAVNGTLLNARGFGISDVPAQGEDIAFSIRNGSVRHHCRGKIKVDIMSGMVNLDVRKARWQAAHSGVQKQIRFPAAQFAFAPDAFTAWRHF